MADKSGITLYASAFEISVILWYWSVFKGCLGWLARVGQFQTVILIGRRFVVESIGKLFGLAVVAGWGIVIILVGFQLSHRCFG